MNRHLLIRTRTDPINGTSRLLRCWELARAWVNIGGRSTIACNRIPGTLRRRLREDTCQVNVMQLANDPKEQTKQLRQLSTDNDSQILLTDCLGPGLNDWAPWDQDAAQQQACRFVRLTNGCQSDHLTGVYEINQNPYTPVPEPSHPTETAAHWIDGPEFALVSRHQFRKTAVISRSKTTSRIVLCLQHETTIRQVFSVLSAGDVSAIAVDLFYGMANPQMIDATLRAQAPQIHICRHRNFDRLGTLAAAADFVIAENGIFAYEFAYIGVPCIHVLGSPQSDTAGVPGRFNSKTVLDRSDADWASHLQEMVNRLRRDRRWRNRQAKLVHGQVDEGGGHRIACQLALACGDQSASGSNDAVKQSA